MPYTVHEVAKLSGVTIKTLYHYQKVGLLEPESIAENGYRYYGDQELERLQQILFYRELDLSLEKIKDALDSEPSRLRCLCEQQSLLKARQQRLAGILHTLQETIDHIRKGAVMSKEKMFAGLNREEWKNALADQNRHLQEAYGYSLPTDSIDADEMNRKANEATEFLSFMSDSLKNGVSAGDGKVLDAIQNHIRFLQKDSSLDAKAFSGQTRFFLSDDFHRNMLEAHQTGLSYYLCIAAENYAARASGAK